MELFTFSFLSSWFTPSSLFLLLNLMIGTIFLTARFGSPRKHPDSPGHPHHQLARAHSSSLLDRVKSINLSLYRFDQPDHPAQDPTRIAGAPSLLERLRSFRTSPETEPEPETEKEPNPKTMTKSASEKIVNDGGGGEKEDEIAVEKRRPATMRETAEMKREKTKTAASSEECVDAKADDFINRFKQQLRLQRLDSLKRFSDMIKGK